MTKRERLLKALNHEETDIVPYNIAIDPPVRERVEKDSRGKALLGKIQNHLARCGINLEKGELPGNKYRDIFGCVWKRGNIFHLEEYPLKEASLKGFEFPDLITDENLKTVQQAAARCRENDVVICTLGLLFFERCWALRSFNNIMMDFIDHPDFVNELLDGLMEMHMKALDRLLPLPIDGICFGDDFGMQKGLLMGLRYWHKYFKPRLAKMYGRVREVNKIVMIHTCGDISEIVGDLIDIGVQIINPFQPEAMDCFALKRRYGANVTFNGGISTQVTLPRGTPEDIRAEVKKCIQVLGKGGGYIMSPTKPIRPEVPTENAIACIDAIVNQAAVN